MQKYPIQLLWFLNRPYENEWWGDVVYKSRRFTSKKFDLKGRIELWALRAYFEIGCFVELNDFFRRHPEKWRLIPAIMYGMLKTRFTKALLIPVKLFS
jgi:hypothetical protein